MATIVTRTGKGSPLTHVEVDTNFTNLNTAKLENLVAAAGAGTAAAPSISFASDTDTGVFSPGADTIAVSTGGTGRLFADSSGRILVGTSTANTSGAKLQTVDGITFPATAVASADVNTLDDYEEGTWTPSYKADTTDPSVTYDNINRGKYTKIGRIVHIQVTIQSSIVSSAGSGDLFIGGLPFTPQTDSFGGYGPFAVGLNTVITLSASERIVVTLEGGDAKIRLYAQNDDTPSYTILTGTALISNVTARYLFFSGSYLVA